jgi:hypothetical protein
MGIPTQQRFAMEQLVIEDEHRQFSSGRLDAERLAFFLDRVAGPPVEGHRLQAKGNHRLVCECGKFTIFTWWSLKSGRIDTEPAIRHYAHRTAESTS